MHLLGDNGCVTNALLVTLNLLHFLKKGLDVSKSERYSSSQYYIKYAFIHVEMPNICTYTKDIKWSVAGRSCSVLDLADSDGI